MVLARTANHVTERPSRQHTQGWRWPAAGLAAAGLAAAALLAAGCSSSSSTSASSSAPASSSSAPSASGTVSTSAALKTTTIGGVAVLTDAKGLTLYWFVPDTSTKSNCNGSCATYWPPVPGPATAGAGVTGKLATIKRSDGSTQATYDGHPLYTYVGDTAPGQAKGNGLNLSGGVWHEMTVSGATAPSSGTTAPSSSSSPSSPSSGY
jgi:predicted lipoprotein with Yx(FWY)xxD motif